MCDSPPRHIIEILDRESRNSSQAHFLKRLSQADEPRMSKFLAKNYATVQKVVPRKEFWKSKEHTFSGDCISIYFLLDYTYANNTIS